MSDNEAQPPAAQPVTWELPPLDLFVVESLEDEARRRAAQKTDVELAEMHAIAARARDEAGGGDGEGKADYWDVLQRAIVAEAARRPDFGEGEADGEESVGRRERRQRRRRLEALAAARALEPERASDAR